MRDERKFFIKLRTASVVCNLTCLCKDNENVSLSTNIKKTIFSVIFVELPLSLVVAVLLVLSLWRINDIFHGNDWNDAVHENALVDDVADAPTGCRICVVVRLVVPHAD